MAETIKSALLVDYESLHRSLAGAEGLGETRLADRASAWVAAIETGRLIGPQDTRRRLVLRRCYAGPSVLGKQRNALSAAGFDVVDVAGSDAGRSGVDMHLAIDTLDALAQPSGPDEFIFLTASAELAPLLGRLHASKRTAAIYTDPATAAGDKALADAILERTLFAEFLASDEMPAGDEKSAKSAADRAEIEAFARKIHAATNIPLFSPKTFAELFKHLTDEIRENGYHFQATAKNVADRMTTTGRQVTRRQVVFIVKGLALKGHVFSTTDTPDVLAEVFREQARYLITNAGLSIDENQERLLSAWFISRAPGSPSPTVTASKPAAIAGQNGSKPAAQTGATSEQRPPPEPVTPMTPPKTVEEKPPAAAIAPEKPFVTAKSPPPFVKPIELPKSTPKPASPKPAPPPAQVKAPPSSAAREEAKAVIAARIAASAKLKPAQRPAAKPAKAPAAPPPKPAQSRKTTPDPAPDELESSILAAIAEAVDVLVDDGARQEAKPEPAPAREPPQKRKPAAASKAAEPEPPPPETPEPGGDDGDIGDQIQRIIASYNRNRSDE